LWAEEIRFAKTKFKYFAVAASNKAKYSCYQLVLMKPLHDAANAISLNI